MLGQSGADLVTATKDVTGALALLAGKVRTTSHPCDVSIEEEHYATMLDSNAWE